MVNWLELTLWSIAGVIVLSIIGIIIAYVRAKRKYIYPVRIWKIRENGKKVEINKLGGFLKRSDGTAFFRIKLGKVLLSPKKKDLWETPDPRYMDEDNRVWYTQIGTDTFVQNAAYLDKRIVNVVPISDVEKEVAIQTVKSIDKALDDTPLWQKILPYVGLLILGIIFIIAYAILMDRCSG